jgi:hypothetical protein
MSCKLLLGSLHHVGCPRATIKSLVATALAMEFDCSYRLELRALKPHAANQPPSPKGAAMCHLVENSISSAAVALCFLVLPGPPAAWFHNCPQICRSGIGLYS